VYACRCVSRVLEATQKGNMATARLSHTSPVRELPEFLRQWDGRPSSYHTHKLAYLAPAPMPRELRTATTPRTVPLMNGGGSTRRRAMDTRRVHGEQLALKLQPASADAPLVTSDMVNAILAFDVKALPNAKLLAKLQEDTYRLLRRAVEAKKKRTARDAAPPQTSNDEAAASRSVDERTPRAQQQRTTGDDEKAASLEELQASNTAANANATPQQGRDPPAANTTKPTTMVPAPPASSKTNPRGKRLQPPLLKPRQLLPGPDGKFEYAPGIDAQIRYNVGKPKIPKARVMTLPWNLALLPPAEQERVREQEAVSARKRQVETIAADEKHARKATERDQRYIRRQLQGVERDEFEALLAKQRATLRKAAPSATYAPAPAPPQQTTQADEKGQGSKRSSVHASQNTSQNPAGRDEPTSASSTKEGPAGQHEAHDDAPPQPRTETPPPSKRGSTATDKAASTSVEGAPLPVTDTAARAPSNDKAPPPTTLAQAEQSRESPATHEASTSQNRSHEDDKAAPTANAATDAPPASPAPVKAEPEAM
jgi:hypothetical protein